MWVESSMLNLCLQTQNSKTAWVWGIEETKLVQSPLSCEFTASFILARLICGVFNYPLKENKIICTIPLFILCEIPMKCNYQ